MEPVTVSVVIDRPREEVFAYLADIANHQEFTDHYLVDWRMTRVQTSGQGAGGRTHLVSPAMAAAAAIEGHFVDVRRIA